MLKAVGARAVPARSASPKVETQELGSRGETQKIGMLRLEIIGPLRTGTVRIGPLRTETVRGPGARTCALWRSW